jgi:hypothetical protein
MLGERIGIIGTDQSAARLALALPGRTRKWILAPTKAEAVHLADEVGAIAIDQAHALRGVEILFVTGASHGENGLLQEALPHLGADTIILLLRDQGGTQIAAEEWPDLLFIRGRLIGGLLVLGTGPDGVLDDLAELLADIGTVMRAPESNLQKMEQVVEEVVQQAAQSLRTRLIALVPNPQFSEVVIASVAPQRLAALATTSTTAPEST